MTELSDVRNWAGEIEAVGERIGPRFGRLELRGHATRYLRGLISRVERKNGWQLAEELGQPTPTNLQHFIARARWNADDVSIDLRRYICEHLGDDDAILIVDETGFLKKGQKSVGVQRQYSGTAGRIENCQIGVFLAYRSARGQALIDRALYMPQSWIDDPARCAEAGVPEEVEFATKPALARALIRRAIDEGMPCRWVTSDEIYGGESRFRRQLEELGLSYVVAVNRTHKVVTVGFQQESAEEIAEQIAPADWFVHSCGDGSKGPRNYRWAYQNLRLNPDEQDPEYRRGLLIRENLQGSRERAYYLTWAQVDTPHTKLCEVAGSRWSVEECFEQAKQETGLDDYEVRNWDGWHRHITLAMFAHATLAVIRAEAARLSTTTSAALKKSRTSPR